MKPLKLKCIRQTDTQKKSHESATATWAVNQKRWIDLCYCRWLFTFPLLPRGLINFHPTSQILSSLLLVAACRGQFVCADSSSQNCPPCLLTQTSTSLKTDSPIGRLARPARGSQNERSPVSKDVVGPTLDCRPALGTFGIFLIFQ